MLLAVRRLRPSARGLASVARLCTSSREGPKISERFRDVDILDADAWKTPIGKEHLGEPRSALEDPCQSGLRFPVGTPVRCFVGDNNWLGGTVVAQNYREAGWPEERPSAPYTFQVAHSGRTVCTHRLVQANHRPATGHRPCVAGLGRALLPDPAPSLRSPCRRHVSRNDEERVCET